MSKYIEQSKVNDEIVRVLEHTDCKDEYIDSVLMAIESLPTIEVSEDCISRLQVLELLNAMMAVDSTNSKVYAKVFSQIKDAPSVLPTGYNLQPVEDCISREWLKGHIEKVSYENEWHMTETDNFVSWENIENAPSVVPTVRKNRQVERAEGEWITEKGSYEIICSNCESEAFSEYGEYVKTNFCPNCGAKMKGAEVESE